MSSASVLYPLAMEATYERRVEAHATPRSCKEDMTKDPALNCTAPAEGGVQHVNTQLPELVVKYRRFDPSRLASLHELDPAKTVVGDMTEFGKMEYRQQHINTSTERSAGLPCRCSLNDHTGQAGDGFSGEEVEIIKNAMQVFSPVHLQAYFSECWCIKHLFTLASIPSAEDAITQQYQELKDKIVPYEHTYHMDNTECGDELCFGHQRWSDRAFYEMNHHKKIQLQRLGRMEKRDIKKLSVDAGEMKTKDIKAFFTATKTDFKSSTATILASPPIKIISAAGEGEFVAGGGKRPYLPAF